MAEHLGEGGVVLGWHAIDEEPADGLDVDRSGSLEELVPFAGQHRSDSPAILVDTAPLDQAEPLEPRDPVRHVAARDAEPLGQLRHPEPAIIAEAELAEDAVVEMGDVEAALQLVVELGEQVHRADDEREPHRRLVIGQPSRIIRHADESIEGDWQVVQIKTTLADMHRLISASIAIVLLASACGGDDDNEQADDAASEVTDPPATDPPATDPPATDPPATDPPATDPPATDPPATDPPATDPAAGTVVPVSLIEWEIVAPNEFTGGTVTFEASNDGEFPHELVLVRGESYETLPLLANGAVDEDAIAPDDFIGRIERFEPGQTMSATWEVPPGNYVLLCNIAVGPNSHAAAGQVLSVTVTA